MDIASLSRIADMTAMIFKPPLVHLFKRVCMCLLAKAKAIAQANANAAPAPTIPEVN